MASKRLARLLYLTSAVNNVYGDHRLQPDWFLGEYWCLGWTLVPRWILQLTDRHAVNWRSQLKTLWWSANERLVYMYSTSFKKKTSLFQVKPVPIMLTWVDSINYYTNLSLSLVGSNDRIHGWLLASLHPLDSAVELQPKRVLLIRIQGMPRFTMGSWHTREVESNKHYQDQWRQEEANSTMADNGLGSSAVRHPCSTKPLVFAC